MRCCDISRYQLGHHSDITSQIDCLFNSVFMQTAKNKANLRDLISATSLVILLKLDSHWRFFSPRELEIWWKTMENNRAPLLYHAKLCASFQSPGWIQTGVTVRKRPNLGQNQWFISRVTLKFYRWPWHNRTPLLCHFTFCASFRIHWWIQTGVTVTDGPTNRQTDWTILRAAWSQLNNTSFAFWQFELVANLSSLIRASCYASLSPPDAPNIKHPFPCIRYNRRGRFLPSVIEALNIHSLWISGYILKHTFELVRGGNYGSCSSTYWLTRVMSHERHGVPNYPAIPLVVQ